MADLWLALGGLTLTALSVWAGRLAGVGRADGEVFAHINSLPDILYRPLWLVQLTGVLGAPIVIAVIAMGARRFRLAVGLVLLVPAKLIVERDVLKTLANRERPGTSIPGAILRDVPAGGLSFPSGHAVILFGMVVLLSPYLSRRWRVVLSVIAVVAAAARVYLGGHSPLDVIGGAAAGVALGALLNLLVGVPGPRIGYGGLRSENRGHIVLSDEPKSPSSRGDVPGTVQAMTTEATQGSESATIAGAEPPYATVVERHAGDAIRVVLGLVALAVSALVARATDVHVPRLELDLFRVINDLPSWVTPVLLVVMQLGSIGAVGVAAGAALATRRVGLARDLAAAGVLAYLLARVVKVLVGRARPDVLVDELTMRTLQGGLGFPSGHAAVAAAMAAAAAPWLPRPWRQAAWAVAATVAFARVFVGAHFVLDVFGGAALGWTVAASLHLLWGAPVQRAEAPAIKQALAAAGLCPLRVVPVSLDARGSRPFLVTTENCGKCTDLFVKVIGYHERNADLLFKLFRHIVFRNVEDESPFATPKQEAEHEAFIALLAQQAGVRTPAIVSVGVADNGDAWLAEQRVPGRNLARSMSEPVSDDVLCEVWCQVPLLRAARIAHRDLRLANVLIDEHGKPWIVDFGFGESGASDHRLDADVAELLVSMSLNVGVKRAVATALRILGPGPLRGAAPLLQPLALAAATRKAIRQRPGMLDDVRSAVADAIGEEPAQREVLLRFRWRTLGWIAATVFATYVLLPQVGHLGHTIAALDEARWQWLAGTFAMSVATYAAAALVLMAASPRPLAFGRTMNVQLATSFANRLMPYGLGGTAVNERYLERSGLPRATAVAAVAVTVAVGAVMHILELFGVGLWLGQSRVLMSSALPSGSGLLIGFVVIMTVLGVAIAVLVRRRDWLAEVRKAASSMADIVRQPRRAALLFGGQLGTNVAYIAALGFAVQAFGGHPPVALVAAVFLGGSALGAASPTPAGLGVVEAALVAGLTVGGVASAPAVAGVLAYRLATFWLPAVAGYFSFKSLQRHELL